MLKLGKTPATEDARDFKLARYAKLPDAPSRFGHATTVRRNRWGMLGNDRFGDCVWAGADHEHMLWTRLGSGAHASFAPTDALSDYTACTGFQPDEPQSDRGTDMRDAAKYRQKTGVVDRSGNRHKIAAYLFLDAGNWGQLRQALFLFEVVGIGIEFPDSAMDQFNAGADWDVVPGAQIEGGHYIPGVGAHDREHVHVVSWGRRIQMSRAFYAKYCDEAVAYLTGEDLKAGRTPEGFDLAQLQDDLKQL
jgi:hypothetical protein